VSRTTIAMERLRAADPLAADQLPAPAQSAGGRGRTRSPRRRPALSPVAVVAVVAVAGAAFVLLPGGAARPADARAVDSLLAAGRAAAAAVDVPLRPGQVIYSRTLSSSLSGLTVINGATVSYLAAPRLAESWIGPDGALTRLETVVGQPWYATARDRALAGALAATTPAGVPGVSDRVVVNIPAYAGSVNGPTYDFARTLPTDPAALEQRIRRDTAGSGPSADVEVWVTVRDMLASPVSPPALRAALYQVAAGLPGVEYLGPTSDRLGRRGIAVALSHGDATHARTREVMIFDPDTGLLLQTEQLAIDPVQWGLPASMTGQVVGWAVWERSGVVDAVGLRPDGSRADLRVPAPSGATGVTGTSR
jgi:hypothetical protein